MKIPSASSSSERTQVERAPRKSFFANEGAPKPPHPVPVYPFPTSVSIFPGRGQACLRPALGELARWRRVAEAACLVNYTAFQKKRNRLLVIAVAISLLLCANDTGVLIASAQDPGDSSGRVYHYLSFLRFPGHYRRLFRAFPTLIRAD